MRKWLTHPVALFAITAAAAVLIYFAVRWLTPDPIEGQLPEKSLEAAWAEAIGKYGLQPVFPPEEDLTVGDVLAVVTSDSDLDPETAQIRVSTQSPFLKRATKIAHIDVRKDLDNIYAQLPTFVPTIVTPGVDVATKTPPNPAPKLRQVKRLFMEEVEESNLPRAAFSSIRIQGLTSAGIGLSLAGGGSARQASLREGVEELRLSEVSAYGLPSGRASELLTTYCNAPETRNICSDSTARNLLRPIVGERIDLAYINSSGEPYHVLTVKIVLVNRVYLTRSILHLQRSASALGGATRLGVTTDGKDGSTDTPSASSGEANDLAAMKRRMDSLEKQLNQATNGAILVNQSQYGNEVLLQEKFNRAVAFGYRGVEFEPHKPNQSEKPK